MLRRLRRIFPVRDYQGRLNDGANPANGIYDASSQPMTGGNFSLTGGFWSLFAVETPAAPVLAVRLTETNSVIVSWPAPSTGYDLQHNSDLNTMNWSNVSTSPMTVGAEKQVVVTSPVGSQFYRLLHKP